MDVQQVLIEVEGMKLEIDIDEDYYKIICKRVEEIKPYPSPYEYEVIADGKPLEQEPCEDSTSRQEFIEWLNNWNITPIIKNPLLRKLESMTTVQPTIDSIPKADYEIRLKADMVDMLEDLKQDIIAEAYGIEIDCTDYVVNVADIDKVIFQKINTLRNNGNEEDEKVNN